MTTTEKAINILQEFGDLLNQIDNTNITPAIENSIDHLIMVAEAQIINIKTELTQ